MTDTRWPLGIKGDDRTYMVLGTTEEIAIRVVIRNLSTRANPVTADDIERRERTWDGLATPA